MKKTLRFPLSIARWITYEIYNAPPGFWAFSTFQMAGGIQFYDFIFTY